MKQQDNNSLTPKAKKCEGELQALRNSIEYHNLKGYTVHQNFTTDKRKSVGKYFLMDDKGTSLTGTWDYMKVNHFIMGYGKAFNKLKN